jgi:hypothetical protein
MKMAGVLHAPAGVWQHPLPLLQSSGTRAAGAVYNPRTFIYGQAFLFQGPDRAQDRTRT